MSTDRYDVIVIGAGMAGLSAARVCTEAGLRVLVLEATKRVGGRIRTLRRDGAVIELGAEFVHGRPKELWDLIEEAGLATYERIGDFQRMGEDGLELLKGDDENDAIEKLTSYSGPDCSFVEYVTRLALNEEERAEEIGYVEGFNAADANEASVLALGRQQVAEDAIEGDRSWRVTEGYDRLPAFLAMKIREQAGIIKFRVAANALDWSNGSVSVRCADGRDYQADRAVITLPLGVLQAGAVKFAPEPAQVLAAAARMRMGRVCRFTLVFREQLWPDQMSFLLTRDLLPGVWWTARPAESRTLTGWVGGPRADALIGLSEDALRAHAITAGAAGRKI